MTGATLARLKSVVTAKYPGTVERAMKLPDGSYIVHVIRSDGSEVHGGGAPSTGGSTSRQ